MKMRERDNIPGFYHGSTKACSSGWEQVKKSKKMNLDILPYAITKTENFMHYLLQEELMKLSRGEVIREFSMFISKYILTSIANVKHLLEEYLGKEISNSPRSYKSYVPYIRGNEECTLHDLYTFEKEIWTIQIWLRQC
ncbi:uncharacterized protein LOC134232194 [Saccostrea cucullata]|uniref:uncharacterized protein LOC134232194 n=1 Tax=Saccostrea cuccullata TaxID=36930 RepID=UPI002ED3FF00